MYAFADRLIVMANHRTDAGFWRAGAPVFRLPLSAPEETLGDVVWRVLAEAPDRVPATTWKEFAPVLLTLARAAGFRSWTPFDRRARLCSIRESVGGAVAATPAT